MRVVEDARRESRRRIQPTLKRPEGWEPPPADEAPPPPAEGEEGAEAEPPPPPPTEFYLEAIFSASGRAVLRGAVVPAAVPPGEWTLHLTDVTEGAAAAAPRRPARRDPAHRRRAAAGGGGGILESRPNAFTALPRKHDMGYPS